jgi:hypothetical protein
LALAFEPFPNTLTTFRAVRIPPDLPDDKRAAFAKRIETTVREQAALAESCDAILRPVGQIRERNDTLLIEHEPATPFDLEAVLAAEERPDVSTLWWITWSVLRALAAVEPKRAIHGGLQLRSLFIDQVGRVKLADFGVASAIEVVCGHEARRRVVCEAAAEREMVERGLSGSWALLDEGAERENGWIAPYFAPEILAGGARLNPTADQFSLGVVLYQIATGVHPLGAELSNPELFGYFSLEPYSLEEHRADWKEAFDHQSHDAVMRADQPILEWAALVYRLLADEPGERFASFASAEEAARQHVVAAWIEALQVLGESLELLEHEQYHPFLTSVGPWCENAELPALWRARLAAGIAQVEKVRKVALARKALEKRLDQGYAALDRSDLNEARAVAREVAESPDADNGLRQRVAEFEQQCDDHEQLIFRQADERARAYLDSAREALAQEDFDGAEAILTGLCQDTLTPAVRREEAEGRLGEIEQRKARRAAHQAELKAARTDVARDPAAAWARLHKLLEEPDLTKSLRREVETLAKEVEVEKRRRDELLQIITEVHQALARGDLTAAEETLAMLPFDSDDPYVIERRNELAATCEQLRQVLERRGEAEELLRKGQPERALAVLQELLKQELSPAVREQFERLAETCERVVEQIQQHEIGRALESLALAETAYQAGEVEECRRLLSMVLPMLTRLEKADQKRATQLDAAGARCEEAIRHIEAAGRRLEHQGFDDALNELDAIGTAALPGPTLKRADDLRTQVKQALEERYQRRMRELREWLAQLAQHLDRGEVDLADERLKEREFPPDAERELTEQFERLRRATIRGRQVWEAFAAVDAALRHDQADEATRLLDQLVASAEGSGAAAALPAWAFEEIEQRRQRIAELEEAQRRRAVQEATAALRHAQQTLNDLDLGAARTHLAKAKASIRLSAELKTRYDELAQFAAELERWVPRLEALEAALKQDQIKAAYEGAVALGKQPPIPAPVEKRRRVVESQAHEKIVADRSALSARLQALASELDQRGRHAKAFEPRVETIASDPLATDEQRATAAELVQRFRALPRPRRGILPIALSAAAVVVAGAVGWYWYVMRGEGTAREIAAALERIERTYADAVAEALIAGRTPRNWKFRFEPDKAFETMLVASDESEELTLATDVGAEEIGALNLSDAVLERLLGSPWPPHDAEKIAAALTRVGDAYKGEVEQGRAPPDWEFFFDPDNAFETTFYARHESGIRLALAQNLREAEIDRFGLTSEMIDRLNDSMSRAVPPWPRTLVASTSVAPSAQRLSELFGSLVSATVPGDLYPPLSVLAEIVAQAVVSEHSPEGSFTVRLELKGGAGAVPRDFALETVAGGWRPTEGNPAQLRGLLADALVGVRERVNTIADDISQHYLEGQLDAAYQAYGQAEELQAAFVLPEVAATATKLNRAIGRFPPPWRRPDGYEESEQRAAGLGYPRSLTKDGRTLLLVNVAPNDPLWSEIDAASRATAVAENAAGYVLSEEAGKPPAERKWYVFYIDAAEWAEPVERDARGFARQRLGNDLPTVEEWLLAALQLRREPDARGFFGGVWDWCLNEDRLWVCGGCDEIHKKYLPWPGEGAQSAEVWKWLNNSLVCQPRTRGDGLTGVRTVLRLGS